MEDLEPGQRYEFGFWVDEQDQVLSNVKFRFEPSTTNSVQHEQQVLWSASPLATPNSDR